jgi:type IV pilus assembly protein PilY1
LTILALVLTGLLLPMDGTAQFMGNYAAAPPFMSESAAPDILLIMDNTASMRARAACDAVCLNFSSATTYSGMFEPLTCYTYDTADGRFEPAATKAAIGSACSTTQWDGNFLNWVTFRRVDAVKKAMIGGICVVARTAEGSCPPTGSPSLVTLMQQELIVHPQVDRQIETTPAVDSGTATGRVPQSVRQTSEGNPGTFYFHVVGQNTLLKGSFCIDNDTGKPDGMSTCDDGNDGFKENNVGGASTVFRTRVAYTTSPTGVIQNVGDRARFGLMVFNCNPCATFSGDPDARFGVKVLTPVGSQQSVDLAGSTIETFSSNKAAMIDSVEETLNMYGTPLGEALYEAMRYFAQVKNVFLPSQYAYPIAYATAGSDGVAFQATGVGSIGTAELTSLTGSEACPAGYIAGACGRDPYFYGSNHTPAWASPSAPVSCCRTFILVFTDGFPDYDNTVPSALEDFGHGYHGTHCTGSNTADPPSPLSTCSTGTDGLGAGLSNTEYLLQHKTDAGAVSGRHFLDDVAYWGHTNDLRAATLRVVRADGTVVTTLETNGHNLPGRQTVSVYSFYAFGSVQGREILMHTAMLGAFEDVGCDRTSQTTANATGCDVPNSQDEYDKVNNYTGASTPDGLPDAYFESSNADDLKDRLTSAITSILQRAGSGTSVSVLASSSTGEGAVYQSYFRSSTLEGVNEIKWTGYLEGLFIDAFGNLREDTDGDGKLILTNDLITRTRVDAATREVKVDHFRDTGGDGIPDTPAPFESVTLADVKPIWEAGKRLALTDPSARRILTWVDSNRNGIADAGEQIEFTASALAAAGIQLGSGTAPYTDANIINFIRGDQVTGLRNRQLSVDGNLRVWKLGDVIHSTPTFAGAPRERYDVIYGDATYTDFFVKYKNRRQIVYAGANDGMLHAFNVGFAHRGNDPGTTATEHGYFTENPTGNTNNPPIFGQERWAFIPYQVLPHLEWLARTDYSHVYYVDLKPKITDVRIFTPDSDHPNGWGTILIGGMRMGGTCGNCSTASGAPPISRTVGGQPVTFYTAYFVLDITNPEQDPKLLWTFTQADLGLSTSYPAVMRVNPATSGKTDNTSARWFMVVGSGPTGYDGAAGTAQTGALYAIDLKTGPKDPGTGNSLVVTFSTGDTRTFVGDPLALDADLDYRTDSVYAGTVRDTGSTPRWVGAMLRLTTDGGNTDPGSWGKAGGTTRIPTALLAQFPSSGSTQVGPVPSAPTVTLDDSRNVWVFFGTGRYYSASDKINAETQHFFGVKDPVIFGSCNQASENCERRDLVNVTNAVVCSECALGTNQVTDPNNANVSSLLGNSTSSLQGLVQSKHGWYTALTAAGERDLVSPNLLGGIVFFPTFTPESDVCSGSGSASLYAVFYQTGSAWGSSIVGTQAVGSNTNVRRSVALGSDVGMTSQLALHLGAQGSGSSGSAAASGGCTGRMTGFLQASTGEVRQLCLGTAYSSWSRYVSWIDQRE